MEQPFLRFSAFDLVEVFPIPVPHRFPGPVTAPGSPEEGSRVVLATGSDMFNKVIAVEGKALRQLRSGCVEEASGKF